MMGMKSVFLLVIHLLIVATKLLSSGGVKSVIAENLLLKQQLILLSRSRNRSPNLKTSDRFILGGMSLFVSAHRRLMTAVIVMPSTLLRFHRALVDRTYSRLFSNQGNRRPGPKGHRKNSSMPLSNSSEETLDLAIRASLTQSTSLSVSRSTKMSCGVCSRNTTGTNQATHRDPLGFRC